MMIFHKKNNGISIIGVLFLGLIILLALSYFKISIRSIVESPLAQDNIKYAGGEVRNLWDDYLKKPATYLWNEIFVNIFKPIISNIEQKITNNQNINF